MILIFEAAPTSVRDLKSEQVSKLVKITDIVVAASDIKDKATRMEGFDDSGVFFSDNFSESQRDGHRLVTMRYAGDIGTCVQHVEDASPCAYVGEAAQIAAALHGAAGLGHGHPARARPPELSVSGRIDFIW